MFDKLLLGAAGGGAAEPAPPTNLDLDLSNMSYGGATTEIVGFHRDSNSRNPKGFHWKPDGTEIYVANYNYIDQYSLTTAWDLSTLSHTDRKNTTIVNTNVYPTVLPDGSKTIVNGNDNGEHKVATLSNAWDISSMGVQSSTGALSVNGLRNIQKVTFNDTGDKCFVTAEHLPGILEFDLSTNWDITSATFNGDNDSFVDLYNYTGGSASKHGVVFKSDGLKVLFVVTSVRRLYSADLTTAWDLGTLTNIKYQNLSSLNADPENLNAKPDGLKVYVADGSDKTVYEYDLSTAWDASSMSTTPYALNVSTYITSSSFSSCSFKSDGTALYVGNWYDKIHEYTLSSAWSLSSATYNRASPTGLYIVRLRSIDFFNNGLKALIIDEDYLYEYSLNTAYDISTINKPYIQRRPLTDFSGTNNLAQWTNGTYLFLIDSERVLKKFSFGTAYDISTLSYVTQNKVVDLRKAYAENHPKAGGNLTWFLMSQYTWNANGTKLYVGYIVQNSKSGIAVFNLSTGWDLNTASFDSFNEEDPTTHNNRSNFSSTVSLPPRDISWGASGSKFYMMGYISTFYELSASTNYDISAYTAAWDWPTDIQAFEYDNRCYGFWVKPDGTKIYIAGDYSDKINQYNLGTAWDINTMPYNPSSQFTTSQNWKGLFFSSDGSTFWASNDTYDSVDEYSLSTNWEINTASFVKRQTESAMGLSITPEGLWFSTDGYKLWLLSGVTIYEVGLTNAWDISTASATGATLTLTPPSGDNHNSFIFSEDGKTILALTWGGTLHRYTASTAWDTANFSLHSTNYLPVGGGYNYSLHAPRNGAYLMLASGNYPNKITKLNLT